MPFSAIDFLKKEGHEVEHIKKTSLLGAPDFDIANYAREQKAILVTKDIEFGSVILYPVDMHYGLLVLRLPNYFTGKQITQVLSEFFKSIYIEELVGSKVILELGRYRKRKI